MTFRKYDIGILYITVLCLGILGSVSGILLPIVPIDILCEQLSHIDCNVHYVAQGEERTCGTDGQTYANFCVYSQGRCKNDNLGIAHVGPCPADDSTMHTTVHPQHPTPASNIIEQVFCDNMDVYTCPDTLDPLCGTDGVFYHNSCNFAKAKCLNVNLHDQALENCKRH